jgi:hypothetical protein
MLVKQKIQWVRKGTTKGGTLSFTKTFKKGGMARGGGAAIKGTKFKGVF